MIPLNTFGIKNFRIFDDVNGVIEELSEINLITGANNSGKSSLIKALQLIKNSIEQNQIPFDLDFTKQEHLLGDIQNVLYNKENGSIEISLPFDFLGIQTIYIALTFEVASKKNIYKAKLRKVEIKDKSDDVVIFLFKYREATDEEIKVSQTEYENELEEYKKLQADKKENKENFYVLNLNFFPTDNPLDSIVDWEINIAVLVKYLTELLKFYKIYLDKKLSKETLLELDKNYYETGFSSSVFINSFKDKLNIENWEKFLKEKSEENNVIKGSEKIGIYDFQPEEPYYPNYPIEIVFYDKIKQIIKDKLNWKDIEKNNDRKYSVLENAFHSQWEHLRSKLSSINYLSNIREDNNRIYNATNNTSFINLLKDFYSFEEPPIGFINKYLEAFKIGKELKINYLHQYQLIRVSIITMDDKTRELVDFGYGIKQLIIILIQIGVLSEKNRRTVEGYDDEYGGISISDYYEPSVLLLEEPETNLHPKWQSLLADMFAEANNSFNIQFIIETHSEYLIRKFQTLVAKNSIKGKNIKIFYMRNPQNLSDDKKQIETLNIKEDGSINYHVFDKGFFDESYELEFSLLNIQFSTQFEKLKKSNDENENKINELEQQIDSYVKKLNFSEYTTQINNRFDTSKLSNISVEYLASGQYLLTNTDENSDFSPIIIQYGRAVENELKEIFLTIDNTKKWMLGIMQGYLEKYKSGATTMPHCNAIEFTQLQNEMTNRFNNPMDLKIELLDNIRDLRNAAGHSGQTKTKQNAIDYIDKVNEFLDKWIIEKK